MSELWLSIDPSRSIIFLLGTLLVYRASLLLFQRSGRKVLLHPLMTAPLPIAISLVWLKINIDEYQQQVAILTWLLGPATVALAIPLFHQAANIRHNALAILLTTVAGSTCAAALAIGSAKLAGANEIVVNSLASKSVTTPIALSLSQVLQGNGQLAAGAVIITGVTGALFGPALLKWSGFEDPRVIGFTLGLTAHGIGTARAFDINTTAGAYASLGMGLTGMLTAIGLPLLLL